MKIEFCTLEISGFKSFRKPQWLDFSRYPEGLHFIKGVNQRIQGVGSNGAGKSSLLHAIEWCLFGTTVNNLRNTDVRSWGASSPTSVMLALKIDGRPQVFCRMANPNSLTLNGQEIPNERVQQIVGLPQEVFYHTLMLGQDQPLFLDLQPREKMKVFADVLQLERWQQRSAKASEIVRALAQDKASIEGELVGVDTAREQMDKLLVETEKRVADWKQDHAKRLSEERERLKKLRTDLEAEIRNRDGADLAFDGAMTELRQCDRDIEVAYDRLGSAQRAYDQEQLRLRSVKQKIAELINELNSLGKADTCPLCGQDLKGTNLIRHKRELIAKHKKASDELADGIPAKIEQAVKSKSKALEDARNIRNEFIAKSDQAESTLNFHRTQAAQLESGVAALAKQVDELTSAHNPHQEQLRALRKNKEQLEDQQKDLKQQLLEVEQRVVRTQFWVKGFKDIQLMIIESTLHELELMANSMLPEVGLDQWSMQFSIEKENQSGTTQRQLNVSILSPDNAKPVRWECWSGGEKQRLRLIGTLALSEVLLGCAGVRSNTIFIDEPTKNLSDEGVEDICYCLADQALQSKRAIYMIDHRTDISSAAAAFANTVTIVKDKSGSSRIEQ